MDSTGVHSGSRAADAVSHWQLAIGLLGETWRDGWKDPDIQSIQQRERERKKESKEGRKEGRKNELEEYTLIINFI
jgi:hypothetical protein